MLKNRCFDAERTMTDNLQQPDISLVAALLGDPARARMLTALMNGQALTATELALEADIAASTTSSHLAKLEQQQLLRLRKQGRHRYFQLANHQVAEVIEQLLNLSQGLASKQRGTSDPALRQARVCYDHLAGELAVQLLDQFKRQALINEEGLQLQLTDKGAAFFSKLGADINQLKQQRSRPLCRNCLDWSERRDHLAGAMGKWLLNELLRREWLTRDLTGRALHFNRYNSDEILQRLSCP